MQSRRDTLIGEEVFPETVEEARLCAASNCDGQALELWGSKQGPPQS